MVKLKTITPKSWLVLSDDSLYRIGLLSEQRDRYTLIAKDLKTTFNNRHEVSEFFAEDIFNNVVESPTIKDNVEHFIKGYPVDFESPFEADTEDKLSTLPLYTKTASSDVLYVAGYFCLEFPKGWMDVYCPKLATLEKYGNDGPFKTNGEMKFILNKHRRNHAKKLR